VRVLSLFSGIGGLDLGLERAGMTVVGQSEVDPYACRVLAKHWPGVLNLGDITKITEESLAEANIGPIDLVCGGFPCQDLSVAGKQAGIHAGRSGLFWELMRVVRLVGPRYVLLENVPALLSRSDWMGAVLGALVESGFDAEWDCIPAQAVGAPHRRDRVFVIAVADAPSARLQAWSSDGVGVEHGPCRNEEQPARPCGQAGAVADADRGDQRAGLREGDPTRQRGRRLGHGGGEDHVADADRAGLEPDDRRAIRDEQRDGPAASEGRTDEPDRAGGEREAVADAECKGLEGHGTDAGQAEIAQPGHHGAWPRPAGDWIAEPDVGRVAHGVPCRVDRLRGLGNAVVPQVAEHLGRIIMNSSTPGTKEVPRHGGAWGGQHGGGPEGTA